MMIKETPGITEPLAVSGFFTAGELVNQTLNYPHIKKHYSAYEEPNIPSGFENIDIITKGFKRGELITVGTRPGNGKTAFLLSLVQNLALSLDRKVALFSPRRSGVKIISRLIESNTSHSISQIRNGLQKETDKAHLISQIRHIASAGIFIDDSVVLDATEMLLRCHQVRNKHIADIIFVDSPESYASHIQDPERRYAETEELILTLKYAARDLDVPVVCFTELPATPGMVNGRLLPSLQELPPYLLTASNTVIFIHRPEFYQVRNSSMPKNTIELIIGKNHDEVVQEHLCLKFIESIDRFVNPD